MIYKLEKTDFVDKEFKYGSLEIKPTARNMEILFKKLNEVIDYVRKEIIR